MKDGSRKPEPGANAGGPGASRKSMTSAATSISRPSRASDEGRRGGSGGADHGWVSPVLEREGPGILRMLWRILGCEQDVMDAFQDCFCKLALRGRRSGLDNVRAYTYRTASNIAIEMLRGRKRRAAHLPAIVAQRVADRNDEHSNESSQNHVARLREAISRLPVHLRNVVVLRDISRLSYAEVGKTLGIEPATARVYRRHAVVRLAELLEEEDIS